MKVTKQIECTAAVCGMDNYPAVFVQKEIFFMCSGQCLYSLYERQAFRYCFRCTVMLCSLVIPHITHNAENSNPSSTYIWFTFIQSRIYITVLQIYITATQKPRW